MYDIGLLTTKSVWVLDGASNGYFKGSTCNDKEYLNWILEIKSKGFEIGYHMAKYESSKREETQKALEKFKIFLVTTQAQWLIIVNVRIIYTGVVVG